MREGEPQSMKCMEAERVRIFILVSSQILLLLKVEIRLRLSDEEFDLPFWKQTFLATILAQILNRHVSPGQFFHEAFHIYTMLK